MKVKSRILLVEDDQNIATGLRKVLQRDGYEVTLLARGDEGLAAGLNETFDVVITDLKLPGLDGLQLVRELHPGQAEAADRFNHRPWHDGNRN